MDISALVYIKVRVLVTHVALNDGTVAKRLGDRGGLLRQQAVLLQKRLQVHGEEVLPQLIGEPHKVADQVPALVDEQSGQSALSEQLADADGRAAHAAELHQRVLLRQAHQAAAHGVAARDLRLVDVDHYQRALVLFVQSLQELFPAAELVNPSEALAAAELAPHLFDALHSVLLEEVFVVVLLLEHVVLLHGHLRKKRENRESWEKYLGDSVTSKRIIQITMISVSKNE